MPANASFALAMSSTDVSGASLPYHEPDISTILILSSFLILLNAINFVLDRLVYCGLIGQILIGVAWGVPGASWLSADVQTAAVNLGYLGLILIVFEGGLSTNLPTLTSNLPLSLTVALIGISTPIGLSFILPSLIPIVSITPVQAFAAGAALCSTSLGTTFTVLTTSGLTESRLGVVLTSAAMIDDVVGLVMVQVIGNLGQPDFSAITVVRPVGVSVAFAVVTPAICWGAARPLAKWIPSLRRGKTDDEASIVLRLLGTSPSAVAIHALVLLAFVTGSSFAGTSNLFAAYLAGACISWFDGLRQSAQGQQKAAPSRAREKGPRPEDSTMTPATNTTPEDNEQAGPSNLNPSHPSLSPSNTSRTAETSPTEPLSGPAQNCSTPRSSSTPSHISPDQESETQPESAHKCLAGTETYEHYFHPAVTTILKPLFFASIGFSIPISQMFTPSVLWRGMVYALLMMFAKLLCGVCLLRTPRLSVPGFKGIKGGWAGLQAKLLGKVKKIDGKGAKKKKLAAAGTQAQQSKADLKRPLSIYPATILGSAMVSRGEIGFLISAVAESNGIFASAGGSEQGTSELFLVVTWAILLCTIIGPISVGLTVKRVKRLQMKEREQRTGRDDPLGIWGVVENADR